MTRRSWIERHGDIPVSRQCELAGITRSTIYARCRPGETDETVLVLCRLMDEEYTRHPFYGSRRMVVFLKRQGHDVNRKRVQRLMRMMGLAGMAPAPHTSQPHPALSLSATGYGHHVPQPGLEHRHHLHSPGAWLCLSGRDHRRVQPQSIELAIE